MSSPINDTDKFSVILKELCLGNKLEAMSEYARQYAADFYNMEKNVDKLYELLIKAAENKEV